MSRRAWVSLKGLPFLAGENCPLIKGNLGIGLPVRVREPDQSRRAHGAWERAAEWGSSRPWMSQQTDTWAAGRGVDP